MLTRVECVVGDLSPSRLVRWRPSLRAAFPTLEVETVSKPAPHAWCIDLARWCEPPFSFWDFDQRTDDELEATGAAIAFLVEPTVTVTDALSVLTRAQRWIARRNEHTRGAHFDDVLRAHRFLYDLRKPLVLADFRHALDTWQWTLRLSDDASAPLQIAALLHDIERIASEADVRVEHLAVDYERFKNAHAHRGSEMTRLFLRDISLPDGQAQKVAELVAYHETPTGDEDLTLLNEADALSFFSLNSAGFLDYYGEAHSMRKIRYTLARMRSCALTHLATMRLRADVARLTWQALSTGDTRSGAVHRAEALATGNSIRSCV